LPKLGLKRMFLHAWQLRVTHPKSNDSVELTAPLPDELASVLGSPYFGLE
jgi:23S rRNA pseudouridine955/2504/2580 synthase